MARKFGTGKNNRDDELLPANLGGNDPEFGFDPRCNVCKNGRDVVLLVNKMLLQGYSYSVITEAVNNKAEALGRKKINEISISNHRKRHLPAKSNAIRNIIERRAEKMKSDYIHGEANLITPIVLAEAMMQKSFEHLVGEDVVVSPKEGLEAAKVLNTFLQQEDSQSDYTQAINQLTLIIQAVRETVPPEMYAQIINKIQGNPLPMASSTTVESEEDIEEAIEVDITIPDDDDD